MSPGNTDRVLGMSVGSTIGWGRPWTLKIDRFQDLHKYMTSSPHTATSLRFSGRLIPSPALGWLTILRCICWVCGTNCQIWRGESVVSSILKWISSSSGETNQAWDFVQQRGGRGRKTSSDAMYLLNSFRKSTPPQDRQLNIAASNSKQ